MIHMKFGSKSTPFHNSRQLVWRNKPITSKLQKTAKGYYMTTISKDSKDRLQWSDDAILDHQVIDGKLIITELKRSR